MRGNSNQKWPTNNTNDFICRQWYLKSYYDCIPYFYEARDIKDIKKETSWRWPVSAVGLSIVPIHQDCSCHLQSGAHRTQARGAYVSETASRCSLSLSPHLSCSLSFKSKKEKKERRRNRLTSREKAKRSQIEHLLNEIKSRLKFQKKEVNDL